MTDESKPDATNLARDPEAFRKAHQNYGGYLKEGGLPFDAEELADDHAEARASDSDSDSNSATGKPTTLQ